MNVLVVIVFFIVIVVCLCVVLVAIVVLFLLNYCSMTSSARSIFAVLYFCCCYCVPISRVPIFVMFACMTTNWYFHTFVFLGFDFSQWLLNRGFRFCAFIKVFIIFFDMHKIVLNSYFLCTVLVFLFFSSSSSTTFPTFSGLSLA